MSVSTLLKSETMAWAVGAAVVLGLSVVAFYVTDWFGVGVIGLLGLVISVNNALHSGQAVAGADLGSANVAVYARQLEEARRSQSSPEQKKAAAAARAKKARTSYLVNGVFFAMTALGFGLFVRDWL